MRYLVDATGGGAALAYLDLPGAGGTGAGTTSAVRVYLGGLGSAGTVAFARIAAHPRLVGDRQLLVDLVGSGWSDHDDTFGHTIEEHAATVVALLDDIGARDVDLVGHSLGGSVAISLAVLRPDLVGRLIVAEPNLDPGIGTVSAVIAAQTEDEFARRGHVELAADIERGGRPADREFSRTLRRWSARGLHRTAVSLLAERPATFREQLTAFARPKVYVTGEFSNEDLPALRATGSEVRVVAAAGHVLQRDNPEGFAAAIHRHRNARQSAGQ